MSQSPAARFDIKDPSLAPLGPIHASVTSAVL